MERIKIAIVGCPDCPSYYYRHLMDQAEVKCAGLWTRHFSSPEGLDDSLEIVGDPELLLANEEVKGWVVVGNSLDERVYWTQRGLEAGKHVLCEQPVARQGSQVYRLWESSRKTGSLLYPMARGCFTPVGQRLCRPLEGKDRLLALELRVLLPRSWLRARNEGVILLYGLDYLGLIEGALGPIDSVWARTRSLVRNSPAEDFAQIALRFMDGKEGMIAINGLGDSNAVELHLFGRYTSQFTVHPNPAVDGDELGRIYRDFIRRIAQEAGSKLEWNMRSGFYLLNWIQQAARMDREIFRKEVLDGR